MKLSIIVPVYNMAGEEKLNHCLDSLLGQTIKDYEIIAVDDCSTDDSLKILQDYACQYPDKV
ncbi:MAG: glycosyltransferase [Lachnospiraceae bacterium]|nr:glycosyltransferase [Lachnospiraceae bacterium]